MWFVALGVLLLVLKVAELTLVSAWSWWAILTPFALAVVWWYVADATGVTRRMAMKKMDDRREARRRENLSKLGLDWQAKGNPKARGQTMAKRALEQERKRLASESARREAVSSFLGNSTNAHGNSTSPPPAGDLRKR